MFLHRQWWTLVDRALGAIHVRTFVLILLGHWGSPRDRTELGLVVFLLHDNKFRVGV